MMNVSFIHRLQNALDEEEAKEGGVAEKTESSEEVKKDEETATAGNDAAETNEQGPIV